MSSATTPTATPVPHGYRPWLDGVRAVAILLVLVDHAWGTGHRDLGGGGVGLFFALSGYLITGLLLDEHTRTGSVSLRRFYLRRSARLVPALVLVAVVCDPFFVLIGQWSAVESSFAALTYTANYVTVSWDRWLPGYGQTWSLAVEEHFYLVWPFVLLAVRRRLGLRACLWASLAICALSLAWRWVIAHVLHGGVLWLVVGSGARADALLFGCAAAVAVRLGWRPPAWLVWAGLAVTAALVDHGHVNSDAIRVYGAAVLAAAAAAFVVGLELGAPDWLRRALSARPLVRLGVLSYGVYLWHYPLFALAPHLGGAPTRPWHVGLSVVSVVVADLSYRFLEAPVRRWARGQEHRLVPVTGPLDVEAARTERPAAL